MSIKNKSSYIAAIDIGTQTFRLAVAQVANDNIKLKASKLANVRLGENLANNNFHITDKAISRAENALDSFGQILKKYEGCTIEAVATAAMRQAKNSHKIISLAKEQQIPLKIIDWKQEATLTLKGVQCSLGQLEKPSLVVDIGGGSTEFLLAKQNELIYSRSFDMGAVSLTEKVNPSDPPTEQDKKRFFTFTQDLMLALKRSLPYAPQAIIGVGGTATTLAAIAMKMRRYDPQKIRGFKIDVRCLKKLWDSMCNEPKRVRSQRPGLETHRADIILAGTALMIQTLKTLNKNEVVVSDGGLLLGLLYSILEREYPQHVKSSNTHSLYL